VSETPNNPTRRAFLGHALTLGAGSLVAGVYEKKIDRESAYEKFVALLPADGFLAVSASYPNAVAIATRGCKAFVATYAADGTADYTTEKLRFGPEGARFNIIEPRGNVGEFLLPMSGHHNVENAVGVYALARSLGLSADDIRAGFASFAGVKRRQEIRGEIGGVLVIDDFAHHPTAVRETIAGIQQRYAHRRLWAVFEPRSNTSRRNIHQTEYARSFNGAARATIRVPEPHDKVPLNEQLDINKVVAELNAQGIQAGAGEASDRRGAGGRRGARDEQRRIRRIHPHAVAGIERSVWDVSRNLADAAARCRAVTTTHSRSPCVRLPH